MTMTTISVANDFSPVPAGRHREDGPFPGETFRDELLLPALKNFEDVAVDLDGTEGYGSSFLEEAFGGLIRKGFTEELLRRKLHIHSSRASYETRIWSYVRGAAQNIRK